MEQAMEKGRYVQLTWLDVLNAVFKEYGGSSTQLWYLNGFHPLDPEQQNTTKIMEIKLPEESN